MHQKCVTYALDINMNVQHASWLSVRVGFCGQSPSGWLNTKLSKRWMFVVVHISRRHQSSDLTLDKKADKLISQYVKPVLHIRLNTHFILKHFWGVEIQAFPLSAQWEKRGPDDGILKQTPHPPPPHPPILFVHGMPLCAQFNTHLWSIYHIVKQRPRRRQRPREHMSQYGRGTRTSADSGHICLTVSAASFVSHCCHSGLFHPEIVIFGWKGPSVVFGGSVFLLIFVNLQFNRVWLTTRRAELLFDGLQLNHGGLWLQQKCFTKITRSLWLKW